MRRHRPFLLLAVFVGLTAKADDLLDPAQYMKIMEESKLRYEILSEPSKAPAPQLTCPRRDATMRVVSVGNEKKLVDWKVKPEAAKLVQDAVEDYVRKYVIIAKE